MNIWSAISFKKFFQVLFDLLRTKDTPEVQKKLLGLIQKCGLNFEDKKTNGEITPALTGENCYSLA